MERARILMIEKHFELWNLRQENSTEEKDIEKLDEEIEELKRALMDGIRDLDDGVYEEVADIIVMAVALLRRTIFNALVV